MKGGGKHAGVTHLCLGTQDMPVVLVQDIDRPRSDGVNLAVRQGLDLTLALDAENCLEVVLVPDARLGIRKHGCDMKRESDSVLT